MAPASGGENEIVGIGAGLAIIKRASTPFALAKTGGSTKFPAIAAVEPQYKQERMLAMLTPPFIFLRIPVLLDMVSLYPADDRAAGRAGTANPREKHVILLTGHAPKLPLAFACNAIYFMTT